MRNVSIVLAAACLGSTLLPATVSACDPKSGERRQVVYADWNYRPIDSWPVDDDRVRRLELPNGVRLGVKVEPRKQKNGALFRESVKISLYDLGAPEPVRLTYTYAGANSVQGYGSKGGADRVDELGDPGLRLILLKPLCE